MISNPDEDKFPKLPTFVTFIVSSPTRGLISNSTTLSDISEHLLSLSFPKNRP